MNAVKDVTLGYNGQFTIAASQTKTPVSEVMRLCHATGPLVIEVDVEDTTVAAAVTLYFQDSFDGVTWTDKKSTTVADGFSDVKTQTYFVELAGDQTHYPMKPMGRVVVTTGAGDEIVINSVRYSQNW
jgi:hypothetical protein